MEKRKRYAVLFMGLVLVLVGSPTACGQPGGQPEEQAGYVSEELRQVEEAEFSELYREMKLYVEHAHTLALALGNCDWTSVAGLGWLSTDAQGYQQPNFLSEVMPSTEAAESLLAECEESYARAVKVWSESPYHEPQTAVQQAKKLSVPQWRELCVELDSALSEADLQTSYLQGVTQELFLEVEAGLKNSGPGAEEQYLGPFKDESAEYTGLLDEVMYNLEQAKRAASELASWPFASLEGVPGSALSTEPSPAAEDSPPERLSLQAWSPPTLPGSFRYFRRGRF